MPKAIIHILMLAVTGFVGLVLFYISRFWIFNWWDRPGLFGWKELPPQGGLLGRWLRGTDFAPYELLIWVIASFLVLTFIQAIFDRLKA